METRTMQVDQWASHMVGELNNFKMWWELGLERGDVELAANLTFSEWFDLFLHHTQRVILVEDGCQEDADCCCNVPVAASCPPEPAQDTPKPGKKARAR